MTLSDGSEVSLTLSGNSANSDPKTELMQTMARKFADQQADRVLVPFLHTTKPDSRKIERSSWVQRGISALRIASWRKLFICSMFTSAGLNALFPNYSPNAYDNRSFFLNHEWGDVLSWSATAHQFIIESFIILFSLLIVRYITAWRPFKQPK